MRETTSAHGLRLHVFNFDLQFMVTLEKQVVGQVGPHTLHLSAVYLQRSFGSAN
jgi:hypothetical protein